MHPKSSIAVIDENAFYCSCYAAFDSKLAQRPVIVLSNNDGNVIARNPLSKALGIGAKWADLLQRHGYHNSIFNYLELEALTPVLKDPIKHSALPLKALETDFAVDSSGFTTCQYLRWFDEKYGKERTTNKWIKAHLMTGVKTYIVTSVEITDKDANDSPKLPGLVEKTAQSFDVEEVSADKGYSSLENHDAIAKAGATPYIAFKANATGEVGGLFQKMHHFYCFTRDAFLAAYHKRSNAESTFNMIKAKFSTRLRSKGGTAQVNEALCKILCHNICVLIQSMFEFGIVPTFCAEISVAQKPS